MIVSSAIVAASIAQPPAPSPSLTLDVREVMRSVERAYRSGPIAERITISVRTTAVSAEGPPRPPRTGQSTLVLRADRADAKRDGSLRLELPALSLYLGRGRIAAVAQPPGKSVFVRDIGNASPLRAIEWSLPSLALPQLQLVFGDDHAWDQLTPFCPGATWTQPPRRNADGAIELTATTPTGQVKLTIDLDSRRLRAAEIISTSAGDSSHLSLKCIPIEPGEPSSWEITPVGERTVATLSELSTPSPEVPTDNPLARLLLQDESLEPFSLNDDFLAPRGPGRRAPTSVVLITFAAGTPGEKPTEQIAIAARAVQEVQRRRILAAAATAERVEVRSLPAWRGLAVFDVKDFTRAAVAQAAQEFRSLSTPSQQATPGEEPARPLVWTLGGHELLQALSPGAECAVMVVGPDLHPARTIPIRPGQDPRELAHEIEDSISRLEL